MDPISISGILVSTVLGAFLALQAASRGASLRLTVISGAAISAAGAAIWDLSILTLDVDNPNLWSDLGEALVRDTAIAAVAGAAITWFGHDLARKMTAYIEKQEKK